MNRKQAWTVALTAASAFVLGVAGTAIAKGPARATKTDFGCSAA